MEDDYLKDMADAIDMQYNLMPYTPYHKGNFARIITPQGETSMLELPKREDKVGKLIKAQGELINEMYQGRLDNKGLIDPEPLRRMIVGGYSIIEAMSKHKRVSGDTLEEAISNLLKRDKERGDIIEGLESKHLRELEIKDNEIERLKREYSDEKQNNKFHCQVINDMHDTLTNEGYVSGILKDKITRLLLDRDGALSAAVDEKAKASKLNKEKLKLMSLIQKERKAGDCVSDTIFTTYKAWQKKQKAVK